MKVKHHTVKLSELQEWIAEEYITFANSPRERKRLIVTLDGKLKVIVLGNTVWEGTDPALAVEKYNSIIEKYFDDSKNFIL